MQNYFVPKPQAIRIFCENSGPGRENLRSDVGSGAEFAIVFHRFC
jgi:hypothetical protein